MKLQMTLGRKFFFSHLIVVLLVSGSVGTYFYLSATESLMRGLQSRLQNSAALISQTIDGRELVDITGPDDITKPAYQKYLSLLRTIRKTNPDIAYIYIMRRVGHQAYFVIDSDETKKQALPGQAYPNSIPALYSGFLNASVDDRIYTDQWGSTLSGYAPVAHGDGQFLIGIDMDASEVKRKFQELQIAGLLSLIGAIILALIFSRFLSSRFVSSIQVFISRCHTIARGYLYEPLSLQTRDELGRLAEAFNSMSKDLEKSQEENCHAREELEKAKGALEKRVEERTQDLIAMNQRLIQEISERNRVAAEWQKTVIELQEAMANVKILKGLLPICAECKKIRNDDGYWQQIESYVRDHTEAEFSHSICPDCMRKLYPEFIVPHFHTFTK
jgi:HAMP domain-containing protein